MFSLLFHTAGDREEFLIADLQECGTTGITEENGALRAFFEDDHEPRALLERFSACAPELRHEPPIDWEQATRESWPPLSIGERFYLAAPWDRDSPTPPGRLRLEVYPGMACGTGRHPATQLCLQAIERYVKPGARVLDVGSGSGILSAAALLMGASTVIGCDIDADNVRIARERGNSPMFIGSADAVRSGSADVVVANIDTATIERITGELERVRKRESTLILSGFPEWDPPEGFCPREVLCQQEWRSFIC